MKKFDNFCSAFQNLKDIYEYEEPYGNVEMTGSGEVIIDEIE